MFQMLFLVLMNLMCGLLMNVSGFDCSPGNMAICNFNGYCNENGDNCICYDPSHYWPSEQCSTQHEGRELPDSSYWCYPNERDWYCSWVGTCSSDGMHCECDDYPHRHSWDRCKTWMHLPTSAPAGLGSNSPAGQPLSALPTNVPSFSKPSGTPHVPTTKPSCEPTVGPSRRPSPLPSRQPSTTPSACPSTVPIPLPTVVPSKCPTVVPSCNPSSQPTDNPTFQPVGDPSTIPTPSPSGNPTGQPSSQPSCLPTNYPSGRPTSEPSGSPTYSPSCQPSREPTLKPTGPPSSMPSKLPSGRPTGRPSNEPTVQPSSHPTSQPSAKPTSKPSCHPSGKPTCQPLGEPTGEPSHWPSSKPSDVPLGQPSSEPTVEPSGQPFGEPTTLPSGHPSGQPTCQPSRQPSGKPSGQPLVRPTNLPSELPSAQPTSTEPTLAPSGQPLGDPTVAPSSHPSCKPSSQPLGRLSDHPTGQPTCQQPSGQPSVDTVGPIGPPLGVPTTNPFRVPSGQPTWKPTRQSSELLSGQPSAEPTDKRSSQPSGESTTKPSGQPDHFTFPSSPDDTNEPTASPTLRTTPAPTRVGANIPSSFPNTVYPNNPGITNSPSPISTIWPSLSPSHSSSALPTKNPTCAPTQPGDTINPTVVPTQIPTPSPTQPGTSVFPAVYPTPSSSSSPTARTPTSYPTVQPTPIPTFKPTMEGETHAPSPNPTEHPTPCPTNMWDSNSPTPLPTKVPTITPTELPTDAPTATPTLFPTVFPSQPGDTTTPSCVPTLLPTLSRIPRILEARVPLNSISSRNFIVSTVVEVPEGFVGGIIYCGVASLVSTSIDVPFTISTTEDISRQGYYTALPLPTDDHSEGAVTVDVSITKLTPASVYNVSCFAADPLGNKGYVDDSLLTNPVTTACCQDISFFVNTPRFVPSDMSLYIDMPKEHRDDVFAIKFFISALPSVSLSVSLLPSENSSLVKATPAAVHFSRRSSDLSGSFLVSSSLDTFSVSLHIYGESFGEFRTANRKNLELHGGDSAMSFLSPQLSTAYFDASGNIIYVNFDSATDFAVSVVKEDDVLWRCSLVLRFVGDDLAGCRWEGSSRLVLILSYFRSLNDTMLYPSVGDEMSLLFGVIKPYCRQDILCDNFEFVPSSSTTILMDPKVKILPAIPVLTAPTTVVICHGLPLDATMSQNSGGRPWAGVVWEVKLVNQEDSNVEREASVMRMKSFLSSLDSVELLNPIVIPASFLEETDYFISLGLKNFMQSASEFPLYVTTKVSVRSGEVLSLSLNSRGFNELTISRSFHKHVELSVKASALSCSNHSTGIIPNGTSLSFLWDVYNIDQLQTNNSKFSSSSKLPSAFIVNSMAFDIGSYEVHVTANALFSEESGLMPQLSTHVFKVHVTAGTLVVGKISGVSAKVVRAGAAFSLDTREAIDPSRRPHEPLDLQWEWSCKVVSTQDFGTNCFDFWGLMDSPLLQESVLDIPIGKTYGGYVYEISVRMSSNAYGVYRSATATINIEAISNIIQDFHGGYNPVELVSPSYKYSTNSKIIIQSSISCSNLVGPVSAVWSLTSTRSLADLAVENMTVSVVSREFSIAQVTKAAGINFPIAFQKNVLSPGETYSLRLSLMTASPGNGADKTYFAEVTLTCNEPPRGGVLEVIPATGISFETEFTMTASYWNDDAEDYPLRYHFKYQSLPAYDGDLPTQKASTLGNTPFTLTSLPAGRDVDNNMLTAIVDVVDVWDSRASTSMQVEVVSMFATDRRLSDVTPPSDVLIVENLLPVTIASLSSYLALSDMAGYEANMRQALNFFDFLTAADCSLSPNCSSLNRLPCSGTSHTCGKCFDDYLGVFGDANTACTDANSTAVPVGSQCSEDSECALGICNVSYCVSPTKTCPLGKSSGEVCSGRGQGVCTYVSYQGEPLTKEKCTVDNPFCQAVCSCQFGFVGSDCSIARDDDTRVPRDMLRRDVCSSLHNFSNLLDASASNLETYADFIADVFFINEVATATTMDVCGVALNALGDLLNTSSLLSNSPPSTAQRIVDTLSNVVESDLSPRIEDVIYVVLDNFGRSWQYDILQGEINVGIASSNLKISYSYPILTSLSNMTLAAPQTKAEQYYGGETFSMTILDENVFLSCSGFKDYAMFVALQWGYSPVTAIRAESSLKTVQFNVLPISTVDFNASQQEEDVGYFLKILMYESNSFDNSWPECFEMNLNTGGIDSCESCNVSSYTSSTVTLSCLEKSDVLCPVLSSNSMSSFLLSNKLLSGDDSVGESGDERMLQGSLRSLKYYTVRVFENEVVNTLSVDMSLQVASAMGTILFFCAILGVSFFAFVAFRKWDNSDCTVFIENRKKVGELIFDIGAAFDVGGRCVGRNWDPFNDKFSESIVDNLDESLSSANSDRSFETLSSFSSPPINLRSATKSRGKSKAWGRVSNKEIKLEMDTVQSVSSQATTKDADEDDSIHSFDELQNARGKVALPIANKNAQAKAHLGFTAKSLSHDFKMFPSSSLLSDMTLTSRVWQAFSRHHPLACLFSFSSLRRTRVVRFAMVLNDFFWIAFACTAVFVVYYPSESECSDLTKDECNIAENDFFVDTLTCKWDVEEGCLVNAVTLSASTMIVIVLLCVVVTIIPRRLAQIVLKEGCSKRPRTEDCWRMTESALGELPESWESVAMKRGQRMYDMSFHSAAGRDSFDESKDCNSPDNWLRVPNATSFHSGNLFQYNSWPTLTKTYEFGHCDSVSVVEEEVMLITSSLKFFQNTLRIVPLPWQEKLAVTSVCDIKDVMEGYSVGEDDHKIHQLGWMSAIMGQMKVHEDCTPEQMSTWQGFRYGSAYNALYQRISFARSESLSIQNYVTSTSYCASGETDFKDMVILQSFILEQVPPICRIALRKCFYEMDYASPGSCGFVYWVMCWLLIAGSWAAMLSFIFHWTISASYNSVVIFVQVLSLVYFFEIVLGKCFEVLLLHVYVIDYVRPLLRDVYFVLCAAFHLKMCKGYVPVKHIRVVQHLSPSCRAARLRSLSFLASAGLLSILEDGDILRCRYRYESIDLGIFAKSILLLPCSFDSTSVFMQTCAVDAVVALFWCSVIILHTQLVSTSRTLAGAFWICLAVATAFYIWIIRVNDFGTEDISNRNDTTKISEENSSARHHSATSIYDAKSFGFCCIFRIKSLFGANLRNAEDAMAEWKDMNGLTFVNNGGILQSSLSTEKSQISSNAKDVPREIREILKAKSWAWHVNHRWRVLKSTMSHISSLFSLLLHLVRPPSKKGNAITERFYRKNIPTQPHQTAIKQTKKKNTKSVRFNMAPDYETMGAIDKLLGSVSANLDGCEESSSNFIEDDHMLRVCSYSDSDDESDESFQVPHMSPLQSLSLGNFHVDKGDITVATSDYVDSDDPNSPFTFKWKEADHVEINVTDTEAELLSLLSKNTGSVTNTSTAIVPSIQYELTHSEFVSRGHTDTGGEIAIALDSLVEFATFVLKSPSMLNDNGNSKTQFICTENEVIEAVSPLNGFVSSLEHASISIDFGTFTRWLDTSLSEIVEKRRLSQFDMASHMGISVEDSYDCDVNLHDSTCVSDEKWNDSEPSWSDNASITVIETVRQQDDDSKIESERVNGELCSDGSNVSQKFMSFSDDDESTVIVNHHRQQSDDFGEIEAENESGTWSFDDNKDVADVDGSTPLSNALITNKRFFGRTDGPSSDGINKMNLPPRINSSITLSKPVVEQEGPGVNHTSTARENEKDICHGFSDVILEGTDPEEKVYSNYSSSTDKALPQPGGINRKSKRFSGRTDSLHPVTKRNVYTESDKGVNRTHTKHDGNRFSGLKSHLINKNVNNVLLRKNVGGHSDEMIASALDDGRIARPHNNSHAIDGLTERSLDFHDLSSSDSEQRNSLCNLNSSYVLDRGRGLTNYSPRSEDLNKWDTCIDRQSHNDLLTSKESFTNKLPLDLISPSSRLSVSFGDVSWVGENSDDNKHETSRKYAFDNLLMSTDSDDFCNDRHRESSYEAEGDNYYNVWNGEGMNYTSSDSDNSLDITVDADDNSLIRL